MIMIQLIIMIMIIIIMIIIIIIIMIITKDLEMYIMPYDKERTVLLNKHENCYCTLYTVLYLPYE